MTRLSPTVRARLALAGAALVTLVAAVFLPGAIARSERAAEAVGLASFRLPAPTGGYEIGTFDLHLVDSGRADPHAEDGGPRRLMASVWYPAVHRDGEALTPYLPRRIASVLDQTSAELGIDSGTVDFRAVTSHAQTRAPVDTTAGPFPVVVYSPGGGLPRALGTTVVEELVSAGYVVVTVDSTYQAPVEFPDGLVLPAVDLDLAAALVERVQDIRFVLDQLEALAAGDNPDAERRELPAGIGETLDLTRIGMIGHSLGGFAAAEAIRAEQRIDVGVNLDGSMPQDWSPQRDTDLGRPFLLFGAGTDEGTGEPHHHLASPDWAAFWSNLSGWRRDVYLPTGEHLSFTDLQSVLPQLETALDLDQEAVTAAIGTVDPERSLTTQRMVLLAFVDHHLRGRPQPGLDAVPAGLPVKLIP